MQHHLVVTKLKQLSVPGPLTKLIDDYLQNRQQRVLVKSHNKCSAEVTSNVGKLFFCLNHITILNAWLYPVSMQSTAFHHYKNDPA